MNKINFQGQEIQYSLSTHTVRTTIDEPFYKAGKIFGWEGKTPGLGINEKIIKFVKKIRATLIVHVSSANEDYWINFPTLKNFIDNNNCQYRVRNNVLVYVINWQLFRKKLVIGDN